MGQMKEIITLNNWELDFLEHLCITANSGILHYY